MNINNSNIFQPSSCIQDIEPETIRWVSERVREMLDFCNILNTIYKCRHDKRPGTGNTDTVKLEYAKRTKRRSEKMWNGILRFTKIHILYVHTIRKYKAASHVSHHTIIHEWMKYQNEIRARKRRKKIARRETIWWIHVFLPHFLSSVRLIFRRQMCRYIIDRRIKLYIWTILQWRKLKLYIHSGLYWAIIKMAKYILEI